MRGRYTNQAITIEQQIDVLKKRGLLINDVDQANRRKICDSCQGILDNLTKSAKIIGICQICYNFVAQFRNDMTAANQIMDIARKQDGFFTRKDILDGVRSGMNDISEGSLSVLLNRMLADNKIVRISHGKYRLNAESKNGFLYEPNEFILSLNRQIKEKFPFVDYCIWQPSILASMMLHVPAVRTTLVDVEREAMESVFMSLQGNESEITILLNPTKEEVERYVTNRDMIIVRPLVKEAPIDIVDSCPVPTLEKMLVDAVSDKELQHLQGNELYTIYSNAFSDYEIKKPRLLRYASRRNRRQKVEQILNAI